MEAGMKRKASGDGAENSEKRTRVSHACKLIIISDQLPSNACCERRADHQYRPKSSGVSLVRMITELYNPE